MTLFILSSNSPRYFAPAIIDGRSRVMSVRPASCSGTSPLAIRRARPSTTAVFPTPGSPIRQGLFFCLRQSICITRAVSASLPTVGSSLPAAAAAVRSRPYFERVGAVSRMPMRSPVCLSAALPAMLSRYEVMSERISEGESPRSSSSLTAAQSRSSHRARRMCSVPIKLCMYFAAACAETSIILRVRGVMSEGSTVLGAPTPEVSATAENTRS